MTLIKFNAGKGMFGKKSDASRMVDRWVEPNTKMITTQVRLSDCRRVLYGHTSETLRAFTFNPHAAWLCFSVETNQGRTFDFAAPTEEAAHTWVVGLSTLI